MPVPIPTTPLGDYTEIEPIQPARPVAIFAEWVDPETGDVRLNASRTAVDGAIVEGFSVERESGPAVMLVGHSLRRVRHTDDSSIAEIKERLRDGVRLLEKQGLVRLGRVLNPLSDSGDGVEIEAEVRDLTLSDNDPNAIRTYPVTLPQS